MHFVNNIPYELCVLQYVLNNQSTQAELLCVNSALLSFPRSRKDQLFRERLDHLGPK